MVIFHSYVSHYQRVAVANSYDQIILPQRHVGCQVSAALVPEGLLEKPQEALRCWAGIGLVLTKY